MGGRDWPVMGKCYSTLGCFDSQKETHHLKQIHHKKLEELNLLEPKINLPDDLSAQKLSISETSSKTRHIGRKQSALTE